MSLSLILACLWVIAATITALLPMRRQYPPGIVLLIAAPLLLVYIGWQHGPWVTLLGTLAFLSMFRRPLYHIARRILGLPVPEFPKDEA